MKVALVLDGLQVGGIERVCLDYCKLFIDLGYDVTIFNLRPTLNELEKEVPSGVKIVHLPFPRSLAPERYASLVKRNLIFKICYIIAYIIFTVVNFIYKGYCRLRYKECREKYDFLISFSSHFNDLTFVAEHFANAEHTISWCHGAIYSYLLISDGFINLYNKIHNIIVLVDDAPEEVLTYNRHIKLNIYKLYNPSFVSKRQINEEKVKELRKKYGKFILMVSRFQYPHKDQLTVIKAFNILMKKVPKLNTSLVFIGDGPDRKKSERLVSTLDKSVKNKVHFLGTKLDVQNYYSAAYVLAHASVAGEGLPTVMIEAMNYGLPEVVTDSKTGPREILGDSKYGLLCKVQDPEDMSQKLYKIFMDSTLYKDLQIKEKKRVIDFSDKKIEQKLEVILEKIKRE